MPPPVPRPAPGNRDARPRPGGAALPPGKRALDLGLTLLLLLLALPTMALIALAIRLDSPGPVFFVQERVGYRGARFRMLKFRSMVQDADRHHRAPSDRAGPCFKSVRDPRVTRVGRLLRRSSLDELPQLLNVLRGEMSLVGPRPALPAEVAAYPAPALRRLASVPGITGLWQVSGRADLDFDAMIALDLDYQARAGVAFDLWILGRTIGAVVTGRGAY
jgi:lipopolysaccharide/colanic/teichoic acid biosynthesis glycosyltransferase